jgi:TatD DNase family protein
MIRGQRPNRLIDIGANLAHDSFDHDRDEVVSRARESGVEIIIVTGSSRESSHRALELAEERPGFFFSTAGVHPHHASDWTDGDATWVRELAGKPPVVAIGETGLDFFRNFSTHEEQESCFRAQLALAAEAAKPVFLHQRDAHERFVSILGDYLPRISRAVAHCFTGSESELRAYLDLDLYVGITGWICDERRGHHLRELIRYIPEDRLLLETDAPYLLPRDLDPRPPGRRNEPMYLAHIAKTVAACAGKSVHQLAAETSSNARRFFGLPE